MYYDIAHTIIHEDMKRTVAGMQVSLEAWIMKAGGRDALDAGQKKHVESREHVITVLYQYEQSAERLLETQVAAMRREIADLKYRLQEPTKHEGRVVSLGDALAARREENMKNSDAYLRHLTSIDSRKEAERRRSIELAKATNPDWF